MKTHFLISLVTGMAFVFMLNVAGVSAETSFETDRGDRRPAVLGPPIIDYSVSDDPNETPPTENDRYAASSSDGNIGQNSVEPMLETQR